ncbi:hypothetical protein ACFX13_007521 [Malus domestica]
MIVDKSLNGVTISDIENLGIELGSAKRLHGSLTDIIANNGAATLETWYNITAHILSLNFPSRSTGCCTTTATRTQTRPASLDA